MVRLVRSAAAMSWKMFTRSTASLRDSGRWPKLLRSEVRGPVP